MSDEITKAIKLIIDQHPSPVFGGSIALVACGLLKREVKDIDLVFPWMPKGEIDLSFIREDSGNGDDGSMDIEGVHRLSTTINNIKACCFYVPKSMMKTMEINYKGIDLVIQRPTHAIEAKITYDWHDKHYKDLVDIHHNIKSIIGFDDTRQIISAWSEDQKGKTGNGFISLPF